MVHCATSAPLPPAPNGGPYYDTASPVTSLVTHCPQHCRVSHPMPLSDCACHQFAHAAIQGPKPKPCMLRVSANPHIKWNDRRHGPAHATSVPALSSFSQVLHRPDSQLFMFLRGSRFSHLSLYDSTGCPLMRFFCACRKGHGRMQGVHGCTQGPRTIGAGLISVSVQMLI